MQNEKLMILKMLESGKITSAEAAQLLQSVDAGQALPPQPGAAPAPYSAPTATAPTAWQSPGPSPGPAAGGPPPGPVPGGASGANNGPRTGAAPGSGLDDLGRKFESFAQDWQPRLAKFTETVAEKIVDGVDYVSRAFSPPPGSAPGTGGHGPSHGAAQQGHGPARPVAPPPRPAAPSGGMTEKNIEIVVASGYNELSLSGLNGDLRVKGYNGDKITARITYKAKRAGADIELMKLGGKYYLRYEPDDFERVMIDAYVPERSFGVIKLDGINAQMDISSLAASEIKVSNANGNTRLSALAADHVAADSGNGRFVVSNIAAKSAKLENVNGVLEADELDISQLSLTNYNGPLSLLMSQFARHDSYLWNIETGNAKLNINLPTLPTLGYHIKAHAAMGDIKLGLTGLQFLISDPTLVEARSVHFDTAAKQVKMTVETSNAPLVIN